MLGMLAHWLGLDSRGSDASSVGAYSSLSSSGASTPVTMAHTSGMGGNTSSTSQIQPALRINVGKKARCESSEYSTSLESLRKTKSDELLRDFEVMRFLARLDECIKVEQCELCDEDDSRLELLHQQAAIDGHEFLTDIVEHLQIENEKLKLRNWVNRGASVRDAQRVFGLQRRAVYC